MTIARVPLRLSSLETIELVDLIPLGPMDEAIWHQVTVAIFGINK